MNKGDLAKLVRFYNFKKITLTPGTFVRIKEVKMDMYRVRTLDNKRNFYCYPHELEPATPLETIKHRLKNEEIGNHKKV